MNKFLDYGYDDIKCDVKLPKPIIKEYDGIQVVRDDLLDGGTKRRKLYHVYLASLPNIEEFVYGKSPRQGYRQLLSLAHNL